MLDGLFVKPLCMRQTRIHIDQTLALATELTLPSQAAEHVARVLRMNAGDAVTVFNGDGHDYTATLLSVGKRDVIVRIDSREPIANESPLALTLVQGVARGEKMDLIVQKATELGVSRIVPVFTERSEVKLDSARAEKRWMHWCAVAASACEQSGRVRVPEVMPAQPLQTWLDDLDEADIQRLALLPEGSLRARELTFGDAGALLVVGPEGGLGERDVSALKEAGFKGLRLGPRILRTETAGLAALAALQALHGDF
jgi:16S rRNA (uracil1498-N3)-methyltransferase